MKPIFLVLSCEHAVNAIPAEYEKYFTLYRSLLKTHAGIDFGALDIAKYLSNALGCDLITAKASRLLIDCNRSLSHPDCFSTITDHLSQVEKNKIIHDYYLPFRQAIEQLVKQAIGQGHQVWHLSIHSFTPVFNNIVRNTDIGLLYNPKRNNERHLAKAWQNLLKQRTTLRVRMNYPYRGVSDGFTSALRKQFSDNDYLGLEVESNQTLLTRQDLTLDLAEKLAQTLKSLLP